MNTYKERIEALRSEMQRYNIDAYIIPTGDPHNSEYVAGHWQERAWISGFTGSAGTVVVTSDHAGLWTDSRYFLMAPMQLEGSGIELHKLVNQGVDEYIEFLCEHLEEGAIVACDGRFFTVNQIRRFRNTLENAGIKLNTTAHLIDNIWLDRPGIPTDKIFEVDVKYVGQSRRQKIEAVSEAVKSYGANAHLISTLDDIGWILNIRGYDVPYNPVAISYLLLTKRGHTLFINPHKVDETLKARLAEDNVHIMDYEVLTDFLQQMSEDVQLLIHTGTLNHEVYKQIPINTIEGKLPSRSMKAIKNEIEIDHLRSAMVKDGVALVKFYRWLESTVKETPVTEYDAVQKLASFRSEQPLYYGESFGAIIGFRGNGAIVHYDPEPDHSAEIFGDGMLLVDSGGQYFDGTTDITRTTVFGEPTEEQKKNYTLVLKGHIALARIKFPEGTRGIQLDTLARSPLWQDGLNYGHGTGHGVGFFMNVHEPTQGFTSGLGERGTTIFRKGMYTSNEPGFYKTGEYGIRIENLVVTRNDAKTEYGQFLSFDTITLYPIATNLVNKDLLSNAEIQWLNAYHEKVFEKLSPFLDADEVEWLRERCKSI